MMISREVQRSLLIFVSTLIFLPLLISLIISRYSFERQSLCLVGSAEKSWSDTGIVHVGVGIGDTNQKNRDLYGIYKMDKHGKSYVQVKDGNNSNTWFRKGAWPSLLSLHYRALAPISFRDDANAMMNASQQEPRMLLLQKDKVRFCLVTSSNKASMHCSVAASLPESSDKNSKTKSILVPQSGIWMTNDNKDAIKVSCHNAIDNNTKEKNKKKKEKKILNHIINRPATTLLLVMNCFFAYRYWNYHVRPSSVAIVYNKMVTEGTHELWRAFSGTFAHFEPLHIGFNMMSLYSLGVVEDLYGSIFYFYVSFSMIMYTVGFMITVFHYQARHLNNTRALDNQTVGYSGILFVWMVIATLEEGTSCPIPVLSDLCFETWSLGSFRFNVAPIAQLVFIQMFMPRASFVGHLGGIISGYLMHWGIYPLLLLDPTVSIPLFSLMFAWQTKRLLPHPSESMQSLEVDPSNDDKSKKVLCRSQSLITGATFISMFAFDELLVCQQACIATLYFVAIQMQKREAIDGKQIINSWLTLFSISSILVLINDAGTLGLWITMKDYVENFAGVSFELALLCLSFRFVANAVALSLAAFYIPPVDGFVQAVFGSTLENLRPIGKSIIARESSAPAFQAFQGSGRSLQSLQEV